MTSGRKRGRPPHPDVLTPTEWRVVDGVRHGMTNRLIAQGRGVSLDAVKYHVENAVAKLGLDRRRDLKTWRGAPADSALSRSTSMSSDFNLGAIGQISRQVRDVEAAEAWFRDVLGLTHLYSFPSAVGKLAFFDCGGTRLFLSKNESGSEPGQQNVLYFRVDDINARFDELKGRGVEFVDAPHMIFKHPDGTEEWMVFFHDCDGQMLALMAQVPA
jgi:catechol 2,3-dioxygenase-like lactoylglutathione lyase family enzyme/DNA-binding CsgD family transcriptional regulator